MFKTTADIYKALLEGKKIKGFNWGGGLYLHLIDGNLVDEQGHDHGKLAFSDYRYWQEYIEPQWYDNIPEQGILCWVGHTIESRHTIRVIKRYCNGSAHNYTDGSYYWNHATPLTQEEAEELIYRGD